MSRTPQDEPLRPGETETDRINRYESQLPGGGAVEHDPDPENEEGSLGPADTDAEAVERDGRPIEDVRPGQRREPHRPL